MAEENNVEKIDVVQELSNISAGVNSKIQDALVSIVEAISAVDSPREGLVAQLLINYIQLYYQSISSDANLVHIENAFPKESNNTISTDASVNKKENA